MKWEGGLAILSTLLALAGCSRDETIPLKDGRTIQTWSTTYGTNHIAPGQFLPWLDKELPRLSQKLLRACFTNAATRLQAVTTVDPELALWTHPISGPNNTAAIPIVRLTFPGRIDSAGMLVYYEGIWGGGRERTPGVATLNLFRRRSQTITLEAQVIEPGTRDWPSPSTILHLHNPQPFTGPSWKPEPFPISRTNSGIRATLYDLSVTNRFVTNNAGRRLAFQKTWLHFEALDATQGPLRVVSCTLSDPGGNRLYSPIGKVLEKTMAYPLQDALFDDEPAWRLQVEIELPASDPSATVERVEFVGLTDPPEDDETGSQPRPAPLRRTSRLTPTLEISAYQLTAGKAPKLSLGLHGRPPEIRVDLEKVVDETGRVWNARETSSAGSPGPDSSHEYSMAFTNTFSVSAKSMNLTFRIYRTAIFEFYPPTRFSLASPLP